MIDCRSMHADRQRMVHRSGSEKAYMTRVNVLFFATLKDRAGIDRTTMVLKPDAVVKDLKVALAADFPELAPALDSALISVNREYAFDGEMIPDEAEVAIFPPVSGGDASELPTHFAITNEELDLNAVLARITLPATGAACFFTGMVRGITSLETTVETSYLEYEAYEEMAREKMAQVADEIRSRWPELQGIAIVQRIGRLYPGTPTVLIACTAGHRDRGAFEAARYGIDRLKEIVPIWKKEVGPEGQSWVEGHYTPQPGE